MALGEGMLDDMVNLSWEYLNGSILGNVSRINESLVNRTETGPPPFLTDAWLVPLFFALIMLVGLIGNSLVIYVISKHRQMRTATNFYIANLASTDIMFLVCCVPFTATLYPLPSWVFGDFMCKFVAYLQQVSARCSLLLSTPIIPYQKIQKGYWYGPRTYCIEEFPTDTMKKACILYQFLAVYLLPLLTICLCYSLMLKRVGRPVVEPVDNNYQVQLLSERTIAMRSKISKMVIVIVLLFTICWGPIQLFSLFQGFYPGFQANYATYKIKTWANCMSYANSSINPIVYGFMGASFRKSFKKAFPFMFRNKVRDGSITSGTVNNEMKFVAMESTNNELK
uniref:G-protein coupled receptors family 1 profile domain-containing protein n=1 Tax=Pyxicephalus adspersus TaxID=30357 RepID=A0AAV2ZQC5_PYXAD|nr:TPA: hypothetical protein GDO54_016080 [Pyxicephalus adspersus]